MLEFNTYQDLKNTNMELYNYFEPLVSEEEQVETFDYLFGGRLYIIETLSELENIKGVNNANLLEAVDQYDVADWSDPGNFAIFVLITSNSGGNSYAIPKYIADQCPNVDASIQYRAGE